MTRTQAFRIRLSLFVFAAVAATGLHLPSTRAVGGDWPQILGPQRNGVAAGESLAETWPRGGPKKLWSYQIGSGYAGPAVTKDRLILFHRVGDKERVEALAASTGKPIWKADFAATYRGSINPDSGPRCVPLIAGGRVFVFGAAGDLHCVAFESGRKLWSRSLYADYKGQEGYFGAGSTPIILDKKLIVNVGGRGGAGLAALSLDTGKTIWTSTDEQASYSSPTSVDLGGKTYAVFVTRLNTVCLDPADGSVRFRFPFGQRGPTVNAATPLVFGKTLFVTASYGIGARLMNIGGSRASEIWSSDEIMSSQYATPVYYRGNLYGIHGREDIGSAAFRCVDAASGKIRWSADDFGVAHAILAGDRLLLLNVEGRLTLAAASPERFTRLAESTVARDVTRAIPALSGGRFLFRTSRGNGGELAALHVGR